MRYKVGGAREVFREKLQERGVRFTREADRAGGQLLGDVACLFDQYGYEVNTEEGDIRISDGRAEACFACQDGGLKGWVEVNGERVELRFSRFAGESLQYDPALHVWVGPTIRVAQVVAGERISQVVRDFSAEGAPVVRLSPLEALAELIFDALTEAWQHKRYAEM